MNSSFILVNCDVHCVSKTTHSAPVYRLYVNDELFAERSWLWDNSYIRELLQIQAPAGLYQIKLENTTPETGSMVIDNVCVKQGKASVLENHCVEIQL